MSWSPFTLQRRSLSAQSELLREESRMLQQCSKEIVAESKEAVARAKQVIETVNRDIVRRKAQAALGLPPKSLTTPRGEPSPAVLPPD